MKNFEHKKLDLIAEQQSSGEYLIKQYNVLVKPEMIEKTNDWKELFEGKVGDVLCFVNNWFAPNSLGKFVKESSENRIVIETTDNRRVVEYKSNIQRFASESEQKLFDNTHRDISFFNPKIGEWIWNERTQKAYKVVLTYTEHNDIEVWPLVQIDSEFKRYATDEEILAIQLEYWSSKGIVIGAKTIYGPIAKIDLAPITKKLYIAYETTATTGFVVEYAYERLMTNEEFKPKVGEWVWNKGLEKSIACKLVDKENAQYSELELNPQQPCTIERYATDEEILAAQLECWNNKGFHIGTKFLDENKIESTILSFDLNRQKELVAVTSVEYQFSCPLAKAKLIEPLPTNIVGRQIQYVKNKERHSIIIDNIPFSNTDLKRILIEKSLAEKDIKLLLTYFEK